MPTVVSVLHVLLGVVSGCVLDCLITQDLLQLQTWYRVRCWVNFPLSVVRLCGSSGQVRVDAAPLCLQCVWRRS